MQSTTNGSEHMNIFEFVYLYSIDQLNKNECPDFRMNFQSLAIIGCKTNFYA